ncbi:MAG: hypothetical protein HYW07_00600 [Candidatus Latescibacteria bacterium]|nr:hypothetical protein [Candidatus Latescibacterota bacterium]
MVKMMTAQRLPDALSRVREARRRISAEFGDDPKRLIEYYMKRQQEYPVDLPLKAGLGRARIWLFAEELMGFSQLLDKA